MKKIKVTWNGEKLCDIYPHATRFQVFKWKARKFFHKVMIVMVWLFIGSAAVSIAFAVGMTKGTNIITTSPADQMPSVLQRIAKCESNGSHLGTNGQVLMHWNKGQSVDIGIFAINNEIWGKKATAMGLDLSEEQDNIEFAKYLYANYGTAPWEPSRGCWQR